METQLSDNTATVVGDAILNGSLKQTFIAGLTTNHNWINTIN
jgi:hypothetical protein